MSKKIYSTGDQFAKPGTVDWANWQRSAMKNHLKATKWEAKHLVHQLRCMCESEPPAWHLMVTEDGEGFRTFEEFVTTQGAWGLGYEDFPRFKAAILSDMDKTEFDTLTAPRLPAQEVGKGKAGPGKGKTANNVSRLRYGNGSSYLAARILRDRPDVYRRLRAGEFGSVRKAAIEAGIVKVPAKLDKAKSAFRSLSTQERKSFLKWAEGEADA